MTEINSLMNPIKLRASIKRMFDGTGRQILSEVLQNSQRAHASKVEIIAYYTLGNYYITFKDNGQGLKTIEDYRNLISLGDTGFDEIVIEKQDPAGIGLNSILANEGCISVTIISGDYSLHIDKEKWWSDLDYWKNWEALIQNTKLQEDTEWSYTLGILVTEKLFKDLLEELSVCIVTTKPYYGYTLLPITVGYSNYFTISMLTNCIEINTYDRATVVLNENNPPSKYTLETNYLNNENIEILFDKKYKDGKVVFIRTPYSIYSNSLINWYGQLIKLETTDSKLSFYFDCSDTTEHGIVPVHPTRTSVVKNVAYYDLLKFVALSYIDYYNNLPYFTDQSINNDTYLHNKLFLDLYSLLTNYKLNSLIKLIKWVPILDMKSTFIRFIDTNEVDYTNTVIFLQEDIVIETPTERYDTMHCDLTDFLEDIPFTNCYYLHNKYKKEDLNLNYSKLAWITGSKIESPYDICLSFYQPGYILIYQDDDIDKGHRVELKNSTSILAFESYASCEELDYDNICVSLSPFDKDSVIEFLNTRLEEVYCGECFYPEDSNNTIDYFYEVVVHPYVRKVLGDTIKVDFDMWDLKHLIQSKEIPFENIIILSVEYIYKDEEARLLDKLKVNYKSRAEKGSLDNPHLSKTLNIY